MEVNPRLGYTSVVLAGVERQQLDPSIQATYQAENENSLLVGKAWQMKYVLKTREYIPSATASLKLILLRRK